jgi:hypothetical protein
MMAVSEFTQVVFNLIDEVSGLHKEAKEATPIPLMRETISTRAMENRLRTGSPDERRRFVEENGLQAARKSKISWGCRWWGTP